MTTTTVPIPTKWVPTRKKLPTSNPRSKSCPRLIPFLPGPTKSPPRILKIGWKSAARSALRAGTQPTSLCWKRTIRVKLPKKGALFMQNTGRASTFIMLTPSTARCPTACRARTAFSPTWLALRTILRAWVLAPRTPHPGEEVHSLMSWGESGLSWNRTIFTYGQVFCFGSCRGTFSLFHRAGRSHPQGALRPLRRVSFPFANVPVAPDADKSGQGGSARPRSLSPSARRFRIRQVLLASAPTIDKLSQAGNAARRLLGEDLQRRPGAAESHRRASCIQRHSLCERAEHRSSTAYCRPSVGGLNTRIAAPPRQDRAWRPGPSECLPNTSTQAEAPARIRPHAEETVWPPRRYPQSTPPCPAPIVSARTL